MISRYVEIHIYLPCFSLMLQKQSLSLASHGLYFIFSFCWRSLFAWLAVRLWSRMRSGLETWRGPQTSRWDPSWPRGSWCRGVSRTRWPAVWRRPTGGRGTGGTCAGHRPWFQSCFLNLITMGLVLNDSLFLFCTHCIALALSIVVCIVNNPYHTSDSYDVTSLYAFIDPVKIMQHLCSSFL